MDIYIPSLCIREAWECNYGLSFHIDIVFWLRHSSIFFKSGLGMWPLKDKSSCICVPFYSYKNNRDRYFFQCAWWKVNMLGFVVILQRWRTDSFKGVKNQVARSTNSSFCAFSYTLVYHTRFYICGNLTHSAAIHALNSKWSCTSI